MWWHRASFKLVFLLWFSIHSSHPLALVILINYLAMLDEKRHFKYTWIVTRTSLLLPNTDVSSRHCLFESAPPSWCHLRLTQTMREVSPAQRGRSGSVNPLDGAVAVCQWEEKHTFIWNIAFSFVLIQSRTDTFSCVGSQFVKDSENREKQWKMKLKSC